MSTKKANVLATALRGFFTDYLPRQKAMSPNTLESYRDGLKLLLQFIAGATGDPSQLSVEDVTVERIAAFLQHLETKRHNSARTRNVRLSFKGACTWLSRWRWLWRVRPVVWPT